MADLITSCSGGRNHKCAKMSVEEGLSINEIEKRELNGQKLQGTSTAYEVFSFLNSRGVAHEYPLFTAVYSKYPVQCSPVFTPLLTIAQIFWKATTQSMISLISFLSQASERAICIGLASHYILYTWAWKILLKTNGIITNLQMCNYYYPSYYSLIIT